MQRVNHLLPQIADPENLREAFLKAARGKRGKAEVLRFAEDLDQNLSGMRSGLLRGDFPVGVFHSFTIRDPKERVIHAAAFAERVLHHAIMNVCEPVFEKVAIHDSYACRKGKGREAAVDRAAHYCRSYEWFLQMDVRRYFDSIDQGVLNQALRRKFKDGALLILFERIIGSFEKQAGVGLPIGSLTSQHFANFYLGPLDRFAKETLRTPYVRYMDDFVCWSNEGWVLRDFRDKLTKFLRDALKLEVKESPRLQRCAQGLNFLGYRILPDHLRLSRRSVRRFRERMRLLDEALETGEIKPLEYQQRTACVCAFVAKARSRGLRRHYLSGRDLRARTALTGVARGTTPPPTRARPTATTGGPTTATTTSASASPLAQSIRVETRAH